MFEARKARKAAEAQAAAVAEWEDEREALVDRLALVQDPADFDAGEVAGLVLKAGERPLAAVEGAALIEMRKGAGHWEGRSQGVSIPVGRVAGRSVRYRVGTSKGHYVQGSPHPQAVDTGTLHITTQRIVFQGSTQTRECLFAKLIGLDYDTPGAVSVSVSNRQKATTVFYGPDAADEVHFRIELGLAHFRGDVDALAHRLTTDLAALDARRPTEALPPGP